MSEVASLQSSRGEFHYFPLLPKELRDCIWEYAALPFVPGIHFFKLETVLDGGGAKCQLGLPLCTGFTDGLGFAANASSYYNDLGAWDACCESRQSLERLRSIGRLARDNGRIMAIHNMFPEQRLPYSALEGWSGAAGRCRCSYGSHVQKSSLDGHRDLMINLEQDVICLTIDLHHLTFSHDGNELLDIPELRAFKDDFPVRKLALQYHPEWIGGLEGIGPGQEDVLRDVLDMFKTYSNLPLLECVYFIDYRIRPSDWSTMHDLRSGKQAFSGRGKTFVEVAQDDERWTLEDGLPFMLAEELTKSRALSRTFYNEDSEDEGERPQHPDAPKLIENWANKWGLNKDMECQFKVLACIPSSF